jgi:hypothetical protein
MALGGSAPLRSTTALPPTGTPRVRDSGSGARSDGRVGSSLRGPQGPAW